MVSFFHTIYAVLLFYSRYGTRKNNDHQNHTRLLSPDLFNRI